MKKLSLAYFGTPDFSARFLEKIIADKNLPVDVKLVVTQPDKNVGRKQVITPSPVKVIAEKNSIPVISNGVRDLEMRFLADARNDSEIIDLALLFAYGKIIQKKLLEIPRYGFWNIHPSLLPKYRGASPVAYPLINGEVETGVTIIQMDKELDHGPIIAQEKVPILPKERKDELTNRLTDIAFEMFKNVILGSTVTPESGKRDSGQAPTLKTVSGQARMTLKTVPQDHSRSTYTKLLTKQDGYIEMEELKTKSEEEAEKLFNKFRGLYPWPGLWTRLRSSGASDGQAKRLKITNMDLVNGKLVLKRVQLEGKKEVDFNQFNRVYRIFES